MVPEAPTLRTLSATTLADLLPQMIWLAQPDGSVDYFNQRWTHYTGLSLDQTLGWSWDQVLHPDDLVRTLETWRRTVNNDVSYEIEYRLRAHDGSYRWFLGRAEPMRDAGGAVTRWFGTCTDIHDTKQLQLEQRRLHLLLEATDEFIGFANSDGVAEYVNRAGLTMVGLRSVEEARQYQIADFLMEADRGSVLQHILRTVRQSGHWEGEFRFRHFGTGQAVPVYYKLSRVDDPTTREPVGYATVTTNLTRRRQMEQALRDRELDFGALADNMPQLAWIADAEGYIYWYNRRWYDYTGTTPEQMEGWGWQSVHDPAVLPQVLTNWGASIATGQAFDMTFPLRGADGVFRSFLTRVAPVHDNAGRLVRWFGTNTLIEH